VRQLRFGDLFRKGDAGLGFRDGGGGGGVVGWGVSVGVGFLFGED
jgi:hypothetical protein